MTESDRATDAQHAPHPLLAPWFARWGLVADGASFATPSSVLQPVRFKGRAAYLKVATVAEEAAGNRVLTWWHGRGAAPVFAHDGDAVVMERATGDRSLATIAATGPAGDDAATRILCGAGLRLHVVDETPEPAGLVDLGVWFRELFLQADEHPDAHGRFYPRAATVARDLLAEPAGRVVLHGDLHHGNVLDFGADGWLAIDPKHVVGDPGFDFANILCNPDAGIALAPGRFVRQLGVIADATGIDQHRMLRWAVAWTGLSACWLERSGLDPGHTLTLGLAAQRLLG
ncbi:aminoglycoside phosphotransferase family protein [Leifsonia sp. NPDC058292]|uniref:aminoglycoside phosphotransferase family protein n=1 Tax=Leifsonia sp. NPDC058292 TaxID=3346428 RepID=UPI0036DB7066